MQIFISSLLCIFLLFSSAKAQESISLRDLNTYPSELTSIDMLAGHPLVGISTKFTAVLSSYPKNSGLASYNSTTNTIGRVHLFVVDTTAASLGRDGMAMQIVVANSVPNFQEIENLSPGAIIDVTGNLTFFSAAAQFTVTEITDVTDKVQNDLGDLGRYYDLLSPVSVTISELNSLNEDGTVQLNLANYTKYAHAYLKVSNATVQHSQIDGARPNYAIKDNGTEHLLYSNDISLRFRNDRTQYRQGYNIRRTEDGGFSAPSLGTLVDISGYMVVNNFDTFAKIAANQHIFKISPMDDGVLWIGDNRNVNGENGFVWNNDLIEVGLPPTFENAMLSVEKPKPNDIVTLSIDILTPDPNVTLINVIIFYKVNAGEDIVAGMTATGNNYTYTFPAFADGDVVEYKITATSSEGITGEYGGTFFVSSLVESIAFIQQTADNAIANSPLAGLGILNLDITATVVADATDGLVVVHEAAAPWSGIYLDARIQAVKDLRRGDVVKITEAEVIEDRNASGVTYLTKVVLSKTGEDSNYANLIPSVTTDEVRATPEAYEGMVIKLENVEIINQQADGAADFGEFEIATSASETKVGLRIDGSYPSSSSSFGSGTRNFSDSYNENAKIGATLESVTAMLYYSFGNPKLLIRKLEDFVTNDWTNPVRTFSLLNLVDGAVLDLANQTENVVFEWAPTFDQDGNGIVYLVNFLDSDYQSIALVDSDNFGTATKATLNANEINSILAKYSDPNGNLNIFWNVLVSDGNDTVAVATYASTVFTPVYRSLTLQNLTSNQTFNFAMESTSAPVGGSFMIPITLETKAGESISSVQFEFMYPSELTIDNISFDNSLFTKLGWEVASGENNMIIAVAGAGSESFTGFDTLAVVYGRVGETAEVNSTYTLSFTSVQVDELMGDVYTTTDGFVLAETLVVEPSYGDVSLNGHVTAFDASLILKNLVSAIELTEEQLNNADVTSDATVSTLDASVILQYVVGLVESLPISMQNPGKMAKLSVEELSFDQSSQIVSIPFTVTEVSTIYGFETQLTYDINMMEFKGIDWADNLQGYVKTVNDVNGSIQIAAAGAKANLENGSFGTFKFELKQGWEDAELSVNVDRLRWNEGAEMKSVANIEISPVTTGLVSETTLPTQFALEQNFPNPFNPSTTLRFALPSASEVRLTVFNTLGQTVATLVNQPMNAGNHVVQFNASNLSSGMYFYRIDAGGFTQTLKMMLVK